MGNLVSREAEAVALPQKRKKMTGQSQEIKLSQGKRMKFQKNKLTTSSLGERATSW